MEFKHRAKNWDNDTRIKRSKIIAEKINQVIGNQQNSSVMEYGCATGLIGFNLYNQFKRLTLVDCEREMINIVNEKIKTYKVSNVDTIELDLMKEEYNGEKFDVIYTSLTLHHILDMENIIKYFYNLLNNNGILCIIDLDKEDGTFHINNKNFNGHNGFEHKYMEEVLKNNGFFDIKVETFYHDFKKYNEINIPYSLFYAVGKK